MLHVAEDQTRPHVFENQKLGMQRCLKERSICSSDYNRVRTAYHYDHGTKCLAPKEFGRANPQTELFGGLDCLQPKRCSGFYILRAGTN